MDRQDRHDRDESEAQGLNSSERMSDGVSVETPEVSRSLSRSLSTNVENVSAIESPQSAEAQLVIDERGRRQI
eukprot:COSAG02_NODE_32390_length_517_cov_0.638756_2_plen_72_part_01